MWETGVTVSSVSEAGIGLDCEAGLLSLDIFRPLAGAVLTPEQLLVRNEK